MIKRSLWTALVLCVASCGSSPPVAYYTLQPVPGSGVMAPADAKIIAVGPLEVPGYLDRPQLVMQLSEGRVKVDEFHRWAEPLAEAFPRVLTANVDELVDSAIVVGFPYGGRVRHDYRLAGRIIRFDADRSGTAVLEVQWGVQDVESNDVLSPRRTRYTAYASAAEGPGAVVAAMNETVNAFSRDIAGELASLLEAE